jgi:hypothetical protein
VSAERGVRNAELRHQSRARNDRGYMLIETLVYMGLLFVVLGLAFGAVYRFIDGALVFRANSDDIARALNAGELWRADVRSASGPIRIENSDAGQLLHLTQGKGEITYRFAEHTVARRVGSGDWSMQLKNVKTSAMQPDPRQKVTAWRWELELEPHAKVSVKPSRMRPLFTFVAVPQANSAP